MVFIEGDEFHRVHSGGKGGAASNNAGPVVDLALLSEAPVSVEGVYGDGGGDGHGCGDGCGYRYGYGYGYGHGHGKRRHTAAS